MVLVWKVWRGHLEPLKLGTLRSHWRRGSLRSSWNPRIEGAWQRTLIIAMKRAQERLLVKVQPRCSRRPQYFGDASTTGWPPRTAAAVEWSQPEPIRQAVLQTLEPEKWPRPFGGAQKTVSELHTLQSSTLLELVLLCSDCDCALVFSWSKKGFNLFFILQEPTVERFWTLKETLYF